MDRPVILLVDDHALFRAGLRMMLEASLHDVRVLEAESLERALQMDGCESLHLILLDIRLPGLDGIEGISLVRRRWAGVQVAMLSSEFDAQTRQAALDRGAIALLSKALPAETFVATIRQFLASAVRGAAGSPARSDSAAVGVLPRLTPRQAEVLDLLCLGLSNKAIGRRLDLSEHTVRGHVQATLAALGASSRSEAVYVARKMGFVT